MKTFGFLLSLLLFTQIIFSQTFRDSVDVKHYSVNLYISVEHKWIKGFTDIILSPKYENQKTIKLDFEGLNIKKLKTKGLSSYDYDNNVLTLNFKQPIKNDKQIRIYYDGTPKEDPFWGGFYFKSENAFNLGIGMESVPHSFGRIWFPCNDTFVDKATFEFHISVDTPYIAVCNGTLEQQYSEKGKNFFVYKLDKPISPYMASVNVGKFEKLSWVHKGIEKDIPIEIYLFEENYPYAKQTLVNLDSVLNIFEQKFGSYPFNLVRYSSIYFDGGAMEHPENIAMPALVFNGTTLNEKLLYHELSHSWFGNSVTCASPYDIWLNEGFAVYSETIFIENIYGEDMAKKDLRLKHFYFINFAHKSDKGYKPIANIDLDHTYGKTTYKKGPGIVHTLRYYLGDSLFFYAIRQYLKDYAFKSITIKEFEKYLSQKTNVDLSDFFDFWVYEKGYPYFQLYDWSIIDSTAKGFKIRVEIRQYLRKAEKYAKSNKLEVAFVSADLKRDDQIIRFSGQKGVDTFEIPFKPVFIMLDPEERVWDGTTDSYVIVDSLGTYIFDTEFTDVQIDTFSRKFLLRVQANWLKPDKTEKKYGYLVQRNFYWTVGGTFDNSVKGKLKFYLTRLMDINFTHIYKPKEFVLLYRRTPKEKWTEIPSKLIKTDDAQYLETDLRQGEFAIAVKFYE